MEEEEEERERGGGTSEEERIWRLCWPLGKVEMLKLDRLVMRGGKDHDVGEETAVEEGTPNVVVVVRVSASNEGAGR